MMNMHADTDFKAISEYLSANDIQLVIIDLNGVLDDYYATKTAYLLDLLGENRKHLPELWLCIERAYIRDVRTSLKQTCESFFVSKDISITPTMHRKLYEGMSLSQMTDSARQFLNTLTIPFIIYTSLPSAKAQKVVGSTSYRIVSGDDNDETKPSIKNLINIMQDYNIQPEHVCVIGDGLVDDLLPATLLGAHTILVSPYTRQLANTHELTSFSKADSITSSDPRS